MCALRSRVRREPPAVRCLHAGLIGLPIPPLPILTCAGFWLDDFSRDFQSTFDRPGVAGVDPMGRDFFPHRVAPPQTLQNSPYCRFQEPLSAFVPPVVCFYGVSEILLQERLSDRPATPRPSNSPPREDPHLQSGRGGRLPFKQVHSRPCLLC